MATPCLTHIPKLSHLYAQLHINIIHPCKYEEISLNNKGVIRTRILKVFRKMWLPWQRLVLPKLSHLYAQLHINIIHPCKYEEISLNNKGGVIRTIIFNVLRKNVVTMATPCPTQVISPLCTTAHQYHPSMQVWRNFIKQERRSYPHKNFKVF